MEMKMYQVDAFTDKIFSGNPAAVVPLRGKWLKASTMQAIAMENNLSETAFYMKKYGDYHIRWFTPLIEVDLCGHATLATAFVIFNIEGCKRKEIRLHSRSGLLKVRKQGKYLTMDFPADSLAEVGNPWVHDKTFNYRPLRVYRGKTDHMLVFSSEEQIIGLKPDMQKLGQFSTRGFIVTAKGENSDFVSRFFAPACGIDEDPVTGSAHTTLTPYWSKKLGKKRLTAIQLSKRRGFLKCVDNGDRVEISGKARLYMKATIEV